MQDKFWFMRQLSIEVSLSNYLLGNILLYNFCVNRRCNVFLKQLNYEVIL